MGEIRVNLYDNFHDEPMKKYLFDSTVKNVKDRFGVDISQHEIHHDNIKMDAIGDIVPERNRRVSYITFEAVDKGKENANT